MRASAPCPRAGIAYADIMHTRRQSILLTGFGPFPGIPTNASAELVGRLVAVADKRLAGYAVHGEILPTEWREGPLRLTRLLETIEPVLALHFGVSSQTDGFAIEMRGRNACSASPDALGEQPLSRLVLEHGPDSLAATLPVHHIVARLRRKGLPARVSRDAGGYLCNTLLYHSLTHARSHPGGWRAGFIHIPDALVPRAGASGRRSLSGCRMSLDDAVEGGLEIIAASLGRPDLPRPATGSPAIAAQRSSG